MKRRLRISMIMSLAVCSILTSIVFFSACEAHEHEFGPFEITLVATCEADGKQVRTCSVCGAEKTEIIPASGHDWSEYEITIPAQCEVAGEQTRVCALCEKSEAEEIPALEHVWSDYTVTPATCIEVGEKTRICELCKKEEREELPMVDHAWSDYTVTPATCIEVGEKTRICELCKKEEREKLPMVDHTWSDYTVTLEAECEKKGEKIRTCAVCKREDKAEIPALEHIWTDEVIIKEPTCVDEGLRSVQCELCGVKLSSDVIPALGHTAGKVLPFEAATCEKSGINIVTCAVCDKNYNEYPPALGHDFSEEYTEDITPTASQEGEESRHCIRRGCDARTDIRPLPRLISESYFRIYVVRGENQKPTQLPLVSITNANGTQVASGYCLADDDGRYMFERRLPFGTYTVTLSSVQAGFEHGEYTISEKDGQYPYDTPETYPSITIHLYSYLGEGPMTAGDKKKTVLNDFSFTTIDGETISLSKLLKEKRVIWFNFYYNGCSPCRSEAPEIVRVANKYSNDVAVVCFNGRDSAEDIRTGAKSIFKFPDTFYLVEDKYQGIGKLFGIIGYPLNVFIDSGGYVFEAVTGSNYSYQFDSYISQNIFTTPEKGSASTVAFEAPPAILPEKQRYL